VRDKGEVKPMKTEVTAEFTLFGVLKREGDWYIAWCPPLDITTQGRTQAEAKNNLVEAASLFLISCLERGTLDQALKELGFVPLGHDRDVEAPKRSGGTSFKFAIPIPFGLERKPSPCHA